MLDALINFSLTTGRTCDFIAAPFWENQAQAEKNGNTDVLPKLVLVLLLLRIGLPAA
jgi:hypothetical protein